MPSSPVDIGITIKGLCLLYVAFLSRGSGEYRWRTAMISDGQNKADISDLRIAGKLRGGGSSAPLNQFEKL